MRRVPALLLLALLALPGCRKGAEEHLAAARDATFEKRSDEALVEYRKALDALRRDEGAHAGVLRARALKGAADVYWLEQRKVKEAVSVYKALIAQAPESPEANEARIVLADLLRMHYGDQRGAIDQLTAALARNPPQGAELQYQVAKLYFELGNWAQCELEARKMGEQYPTSALVDDAMFLQAQALAMLEGKRSEASRTFAGVVQRFPDSELAPHATFELGKLRAEAGEDEEAIEIWVAALKTHPNPPIVQDAIARARRRIAATTVKDVGDRDVALAKPLGPPAAPRRPHRSSLEAVGGKADEASSERGD